MNIADIPFVTLVRAAPCNAADAIALLNAQLVERGYTEPAYSQAVAERELVYPTGLPTQPPVAIPHANPDYVNESAAAVGVFQEPIEFLEMGNPDSKLGVRLVFLLALTEKEAAVQVLGQLTRVFRKGDELSRLQQATGAAEAAAILKEMINGVDTPREPASPEPTGEK